MKKYLLLLLLLLAIAIIGGCVVVNNKPPQPPIIETPPMPVMPGKPKTTTADLVSPPLPTITFTQARLAQTRTNRPAEQHIVAAGSTNLPAPRIPVFIFKTNGNFRIEASTNLIAWWPVAEVYSVTNITLVSKTVSKRPYLFYRLTKL